MILQLLKIDLGITHDKRDSYFTSLIAASKSELEGRIGKTLTDSTEDQMLIADYAAWNYRKRAEDIPLSANLLHRIRNRQVKARAEKYV